MALAMHGDLPDDEADFVNRCQLADRMKWTFDEIDSIDIADYRRLLTVLEASDRARAFRAERGG